MWLTQDNLAADVPTSLNDCMLLLYIVCERYPSARRYRDVFERVKAASARMPQALHGNQSQPDAGLLSDAPAFHDSHQAWPDGLSNELLQMIDEMSGQAIDPFLGMATQPDSMMRYPMTGTWWT